jgi:hypothetical protein
MSVPQARDGGRGVGQTQRERGAAVERGVAPAGRDELRGEEQLSPELSGSVPEVAAKLKEPSAKDKKFEDVVKEAEQAAVLVLVY